MPKMQDMINAVSTGLAEQNTNNITYTFKGCADFDELSLNVKRELTGYFAQLNGTVNGETYRIANINPAIDKNDEIYKSLYPLYLEYQNKNHRHNKVLVTEPQISSSIHKLANNFIENYRVQTHNIKDKIDQKQLHNTYNSTYFSPWQNTFEMANYISVYHKNQNAGLDIECRTNEGYFSYSLDSGNPAHNTIIQNFNKLAVEKMEKFDSKNHFLSELKIYQFLENAGKHILSHNQKTNNPDNIKYDILFQADKNGDYKILDNKGFYKFDGTVKQNDLINAINIYKNKNITIAFQNYNQPVTKTYLSQADANNNSKNHIIKTIADSIKNGTSVLQETRSGPDYSYNCDTGKPFSGATQLYLQQIRKNNHFKSNMFSKNINKDALKKKSKSNVVAEYSSGKNSLHLYSNFDQAYAMPQNALAAEPLPVSKTKNAGKLSSLERGVKSYLASIYTGEGYAPGPELLENKKEIAADIISGKINIIKIADDMEKSLQFNNQQLKNALKRGMGGRSV